MSNEALVFLIILDFNCVAVVGYLLWFLVFKPKKDNRKQYFLYALIMILCPVIGPMYFLCTYLKFRLIRFGDRDLSDVEFSKKRYAARTKADEERERNIVPVEEAILISDQEKKRANMLNILLGETDEALSAIAMALESDDSEVAHYAASFLQSKLDAFREHVRSVKQHIQNRKAEGEFCVEETLGLIGNMNQVLKQKVLTDVEQLDYVRQMEGLCQEVYETARDRLEPGHYSGLFYLLMDLQEFENAEIWAERFFDRYPEQLLPYTLRIKLYFETGQADKFQEVLTQLRGSAVEIDNQTLELIRMIQC